MVASIRAEEVLFVRCQLDGRVGVCRWSTSREQKADAKVVCGRWKQVTAAMISIANTWQ